MKTTIKYLFVLVLAGFVFTGCAMHRCCKSQEWEYKAITLAGTGNNADTELNKIGKDGWQLIAVVGDSSNSGNSAFYYFKRPKQ